MNRIAVASAGVRPSRGVRRHLGVLQLLDGTLERGVRALVDLFKLLWDGHHVFHHAALGVV
jgi:hypothetical protein